MVKFYIIIAYYNPKEYWLIRCVESIIENKYKNIEIIFLNDGSINKNFINEKIKDTLKRNNIKYQDIYIEHCGNAVAKSKALNYCTENNSYIWYVDCDDTIENNALHDLNAFIQKNKDIDLINCNLKSFLCEENENFENYLISSWPKKKYDEIVFNPQKIFFNKYLENLSHMWDWSCAVNIFRKNFMDGFGENVLCSEKIIYEDIYNVLFLSAFATRIASIDKSIYIYWKNRADSASKKISSKHDYFLEVINIFQKLVTKINEYIDKKKFNKDFFNSLFQEVFINIFNRSQYKTRFQKRKIYKKIKSLLSNEKVFFQQTKNNLLKSFKSQYYYSLKKIIKIVVKKIFF
ncbi:MAG: glycosyltransferase family 2 protein [Malacoplasma sp.]|nr:glycosyltransferase family 2 protein [Malacoplasma sp.]